MKETLNFDFCTMTIYNNYIVVVVNEGIDIKPEHNNALIEVAETYFKDSSFIYITHRINSYSVDPKIYYETAKIESLKGFAVVSSNYKAKVNAKIEQMFFTKPFEIFTTLEEAFTWADNLIK